MAKKKNVITQENDYGDFDFNELIYSDDTMADMMGNMIELNNQQMMMAIELTKIIVSNNTETIKDMEKYVFSVFKNAAKVIGDNFDVKNIVRQFEE